MTWGDASPWEPSEGSHVLSEQNDGEECTIRTGLLRRSKPLLERKSFFEKVFCDTVDIQHFISFWCRM